MATLCWSLGRILFRRLGVRLHRVEHDLLGSKAVPGDAYYGVQTARGLENFHISGVQIRLYPDFISALAMVKWAAARANFDCGVFDRTILEGIEGAQVHLDYWFE